MSLKAMPPPTAMLDNCSKWNTSQSFFAGLPVEVRLMIWSLILGNRILHVELSGVYVCQDDTTPQEEYIAWKSALIGRSLDETQTEDDSAAPSSTDMNTLPNPHLYYDHERCQDPVLGKVSQLPGNRLMRACKFISQEVSHVFWTTNIFSFRNAAGFQRFLDYGGMVRKQSITTIHLRGDFGFAWHEVLPRSLITNLTGLKRLHINVSGTVVGCLSNRGGTSIIAILECLSRFKILSIEKCTVIIEDVAERSSTHPIKSPIKSNLSAQALRWSQKLEKNILVACETTEEQRAMMDVMLAREICLKSSTLEGCHLFHERFAKTPLLKCRKLHVCLNCWKSDGDIDVRQRLEAAKNCSRPGQCGD